MNKKSFGEKVITKVVLYIVAVIIVLVWGLVWAFPLMWAWNYVMPYLFGLPSINWWRMWSLYLILSSLWKINIFSGK